VPQDIFWRNLAEECVDAGVGVNMFLFPNQYIDVATIGESGFSICSCVGEEKEGLSEIELTFVSRRVFFSFSQVSFPPLPEEISFTYPSSSPFEWEVDFELLSSRFF